MNQYLDIHLRPDPELAPHQLMSGLYARLHRALVQLNSNDIGVSLPGHDDRKPSTGTHLRLHASEEALQALMAIDWLKGMQDHLCVVPMAVVPENVQHRVVSRVQSKSSPARLRRRAMRRHDLDAEVAAQRISGSSAVFLRLPFVTLGSRSTAQPSFPLFIRHGPMLPTSVAGVFNSYGLSRQATIPWF